MKAKLEILIRLQERIRLLINQTPSGEKRNEIIEENIILLGIIEKCKKEEKIEMISVESPNVESIGYNEPLKILAIKFINQALYYYKEVPKNIFEELLKAPSIGSYLHRNIKGKFSYVRMS